MKHRAAWLITLVMFGALVGCDFGEEPTTGKVIAKEVRGQGGELTFHLKIEQPNGVTGWRKVGERIYRKCDKGELFEKCSR